VGTILKALEESGQSENTLVLFLSDHGMPLPFAKTAVYHHSTHTPLIVRWPGQVKAGTIDKQHMVSAVDFLPTLLDAVEAEHPQGLEGRSFLPLLKGESQTRRDMIVKEYSENSGGARQPMRSVQTKKFGYIYNPWADGKRVVKTATQGTLTYRRMKALAPTDEKIAARLELFDHRVPEEFYDYEKDPDALHNLIDDPAYQEEVNKLRKEMLAWMERSGDPMLECFRHRDDPKVVEAFMAKEEQESADRRKPKREQNPQQRARRNAKLIELNLPQTIKPGETIEVSIPHTFPKRLGEQQIHVTLKDGNGKRLDRQVLKATGEGTATASFQIPDNVPGSQVQFAAFVGEDFQNHLQHLNAGPVDVK
jgi:N-sulfoglucosamine sulfohydrolase